MSTFEASQQVRRGGRPFKSVVFWRLFLKKSVGARAAGARAHTASLVWPGFARARFVLQVAGVFLFSECR